MRLAPSLIIAICLGSGGLAPVRTYAQEAQSQPATRTAPAESSPERIAELAALIEGPNSAAARETGARELLRDGSPEAFSQLVAILNGSNTAAKVAIANVFATNGGRVDPSLLDALLPMLAASEPEAVTAAVSALAAGGEPGSLRLKNLIQADATPLSAKLAAIRALGMMTDLSSARTLVGLLQSTRPELARAACDAFESATGIRYQGDIAAALGWWRENGTESPADWQSRQLRRFAAERRRLEGALQGLEQRLARSLRENYQRSPEGDRGALFHAYLSDSLVVVQRVGLELAQAEMAESRALRPEAVGLVRRLMASEDAGVREAAVQTLAAHRDVADADRFLERLATERVEAVRRALLNGLGYLGGDVAAGALARQLDGFSGSSLGEAVTALGRMIERGVVQESTQDEIAGVFLARFRDTPRENGALRERLLWAMSRLRRAAFAQEFVVVLSGQDAAVVRQTALRGIAALESIPPEAVEAIQRAVSDPDASVRRTAVEALASMAPTDAQIEALWSRLARAVEPDEAVREAAWRAILRILDDRPAPEIEAWVERLPAGDSSTPRRSIELLTAAIGGATEEPAKPEEFGRLRQRVALVRESLGQIDKAIESYALAIADFRAASSALLGQAAADFLRLLLVNRRYDEASSRLLSNTADPAVFVAVLTREAEARLTDDPAAVEMAVAMLDAFRARPPAPLPPEQEQAVVALADRAKKHLAELDAGRVDRALDALRSNPDDVAAREQILGLGGRAAAVLCAELEKVLAVEPPNEREERFLVELLRVVLPDWPGFAPDADLATKRQILETARRNGISTVPAHWLWNPSRRRA